MGRFLRAGRTAGSNRRYTGLSVTSVICGGDRGSSDAQAGMHAGRRVLAAFSHPGCLYLGSAWMVRGQAAADSVAAGGAADSAADRQQRTAPRAGSCGQLCGCCPLDLNNDTNPRKL